MVRVDTTQDPDAGVPEGFAIVQVPPLLDAVTVNDVGTSPAPTPWVTETVACPSPGIAVGGAGVSGAEGAAR